MSNNKNKKKVSKEIFMKIKMYILSLWLLFILIIIATIDIRGFFKGEKVFLKLLFNNTISIICIIFIFSCFKFFYEFRHNHKGTRQLPVTIKKIKDINSDYLSFLTTYVIPFVFIDFNSKRQIVIFIILLITIGSIYVKTNLFYSNPTLALLGYHIYEVETDRSDVCGTLISLEKLEVGSSIGYIRLNKNVFFVGGL